MLQVLYRTTDACKIQRIYCHVHSEERQVSLYSEILSLLSTLNAKTSPNYLKIKTDIHISKT